MSRITTRWQVVGCRPCNTMFASWRLLLLFSTRDCVYLVLQNSQKIDTFQRFQRRNDTDSKACVRVPRLEGLGVCKLIFDLRNFAMYSQLYV